MELYILRHAIAEERDSGRWPDDAYRPLTAKGRKRMQRVAEGLLALGLSFDVIFTSPYTRATQTANIVAEVFGAEKILQETNALATNGDPEKLISLIKGMSGKLNSVLIVGHEPYLSDLISVLLIGDSSLPITMKKGGVCKLNVGNLRHGPCASLDWLLPPSVSILKKKKK